MTLCVCVGGGRWGGSCFFLHIMLCFKFSAAFLKDDLVTVSVDMYVIFNYVVNFVLGILEKSGESS